MTSPMKAYRAAILHSIADPAVVGVEQSYEYFEDGLLVIENSQVANVGHAADLLPSLMAFTQAGSRTRGRRSGSGK